MTEGRLSRSARLRNEFPGFWATSSQDFIGIAKDLFKLSEAYAGKFDGNVSIYTLPAIPMLFSALRCLLIELNSGVFDHRVNLERLKALDGPSSEPQYLIDHYNVPSDLARRLELLWEVRNEIIHPVHRPGPERSGTPEYLAPLRNAGLLQSTGKDDDFVWMGQLKSHRLLVWAFEGIAKAVNLLLQEHTIQGLSARGLRASYSLDENMRWWEDP
jgi:hypothetical protein